MSVSRLKPHVSCTWLQLAVVVFGFVPVLAGGYGAVFGGVAFSDETVRDLTLDSHIHYLSGLLLGIGLLFWSCVPRIEERRTEFRLLTIIVFIGGLARLWAMAHDGIPSPGMICGLGMELVVTPLLCVWQHRVSHQVTNRTF